MLNAASVASNTRLDPQGIACGYPIGPPADRGIVEGGAIDYGPWRAPADKVNMVNGTRVTVSGEAIVRTGSSTAWAYGRVSGERWGVELPCAA
jgi:hypothetical protein